MQAAAAGRVLQWDGVPPAPTPLAGHILHPRSGWASPVCTCKPQTGHLLHPQTQLGTSCTPRPIWGPQGLSGSRHAHKPPSLSPSGPATQQIFRGSEKYEHFPGTGSSVLSSCSCQHREGARPWGGMRDAQTGPLARRCSDLWHGNAWPISTATFGPPAQQFLAHQHGDAGPISTVSGSARFPPRARGAAPSSCPPPGAGVDGGRVSAGFQGQLQSV